MDSPAALAYIISRWRQQSCPQRPAICYVPWMHPVNGALHFAIALKTALLLPFPCGPGAIWHPTVGARQRGTLLYLFYPREAAEYRTFSIRFVFGGRFPECNVAFVLQLWESKRSVFPALWQQVQAPGKQWFFKAFCPFVLCSVENCNVAFVSFLFFRKALVFCPV